MQRSARPDWVSWVSRNVIRRLPPRLVRTLCIVDLVLSFLPFWAFSYYRRWTGKRTTLEEFVRIYPLGVRFVLKHFWHTSEGTGPFALDWSTGPVRRAQLPERKDWATPGSCGSCRNCCTTHWLPPEERATCPFLEPTGFCGVHGGVWWDYLNCGRYPAEPAFTRYYDCRRFTAPAPVPAYSPAA